MKKFLLLTLMAFLVAACADESTTDNSENNSGEITPPQYDTSKVSPDDKMIDLWYNFDLATRWKNFIPNQTKDGVLFPHSYHNKDLTGKQFETINGEAKVFIQNCSTCHTETDGKKGHFMQDNFTADNYKFNGYSDNRGHNFCWSCHSQIKDGRGPSESTGGRCNACHRIIKPEK